MQTAGGRYNWRSRTKGNTARPGRPTASGLSFNRTLPETNLGLFAVPSGGGELINLTNTPEIREENPRWSPDGKTIALNHKPKEATVYNIALMDWATRKVTLLTHESTPEPLVAVGGLEPRRKDLYANRMEVSFTDADIYAIDIASGKSDEFDPASGEVAQCGLFAVQGRKDASDNIQRQKRLPKCRPPRHRRKENHVGHGNQVEASAGDFSPDGKRFTYTDQCGRSVRCVSRRRRNPKAERIPGSGWSDRPCRLSQLIFGKSVAAVAREFCATR